MQGTVVIGMTILHVHVAHPCSCMSIHNVAKYTSSNRARVVRSAHTCETKGTLCYGVVTFLGPELLLLLLLMLMLMLMLLLLLLLLLMLLLLLLLLPRPHREGAGEVERRGERQNTANTQPGCRSSTGTLWGSKVLGHSSDFLV